jgi:hypothetical protein
VRDRRWREYAWWKAVLGILPVDLEAGIGSVDYQLEDIKV